MLTATTPFDDILVVLQAWGLPPLLLSVLAMTWRYLFLLAAEAQRLMRARAARSGRARLAPRRGGGTLLWRARVTGGMAGNLLLRGTERAERVYAAMAARGYDGHPRARTVQTLTRGERVLLWSGLGGLILLTLLGLLAWG